MKKKVKRFLSLLLTAALVFTLLPAKARAEPAVWDGTLFQPGGEGTSTSHYIIDTAEELAWFADKVNTGSNQTLYADLAADIVLNDTSNWTEWAEAPPDNEWTPIGSSVNSNRIIFDGCGYAVSGLYIDSTENYVGLFGYVGRNSAGFESTVKNLTLKESYIKGAQYVGGICGYLYKSSTISGCGSSAAVVGTGQYAGGIAGFVYNQASVTDCKNSGAVSGSRYVGGIAGRANYTSSITNCKNEGAVSAGSTNAGGIAGSNSSTLTNAYNTAAVSGSGQIGGICGNNEGAVVSKVYSTGVITGTTDTGKVCGQNAAGGSVTSAWFSGAPTDKGVGTNYGAASVYYASAAQFASGEVAYLLGSAFGQELGTDSFPVFRSSEGGNAVYKLVYTVDSAEYAVQYYNAGDTVSTAGIPEPTMEGGYFVSWSGLPATMPESDLTVSAGFNTGVSPAPNITTESLPVGYKGVAYTAAVSATGQTPITFSLSGGTSLPSGLALNADTGVISGTPAETGTTSFTIEASNAAGAPDTHDYTLTVSEPTPVITTASLPAGYKGEAYSAAITATGPGMITYTLDNATPLPGGLTFDGTTGAIAGTPSETGSFTVKFIAESEHGNDEAMLTLSVQIRTAGSGTQSDPYRISTADQMFQFAAIVNRDTSKYYYAELMNDIALNDTSAWESWAAVPPANQWTPIGTGLSSLFRGVFNGNNHTLSGVYLKQTGDYAGLFGGAGGAGIAIKNLTLSKSYIEGANYVGGICGYLSGNATTAIENCKSAATVYGGRYVGGICGSTIYNTNVRDCQNSGSVTGGQYAGGIVGQNYGNVSGCRNSGTISPGAYSPQFTFGGICGHNYGAVTDSYNQGALVCPLVNNIGGVCGANTGTITNAYSTGYVPGVSGTTDKLCGFGAPSSVLTNCYFLGSATDAGIGNSGTYNGSGTATAKSAAQFASGEVAYLLGSAFGQELGGSADAHPVFRSPDGSNAVYKLTYTVGSAEYAAQYYNAGDTVSTAGIAEPIISGSRFSNWQNLQGTMPGADVTVSAVFLTVSATIDPTAKTFPEVIENYGQQTAQQFTVTNTGESEITGLSASLSGGTNSAFEISAALSADSLDAGGTATVSVIPRAGLPANTYTNTLTITGDNGISLTVNLSFMVNYTVPPVNTAPVRKATVPATAVASVTVNTAYTLDLSTIFEDADADTLSYKVSVNEAAYIAAAASYTYIPTAAGTITLVFKANDGMVNSIDTYTVTLTANPAPVVNATISPDTGSFDKYAPADVLTTVTWGSATGITDVKAGGLSIGAGNYSVSGNTLTIRKEYPAAQSTGSLVLTVEFNAGASATLTIAITDTTPPTINYASRNYDLSAPADVTVTIAWNSAASVTDLVYSVSPDTTLYTLDTGDYTVIGNDLTIKNSFFSGLPLTTGAALDFNINFNTGATVALMVNVVDGYVPGSNADLSSLSVNGTPVNGFDPNDTEYDVELPYGSSSATVAATTSDPNAGYTISPAPTLPVPGTATVTVTAEDGTPKTYTISFTIGAAPIVTVTNITVTGTGGVSSVQVGNTLQMLAEVLPANATDRNVSWSIEAGNGADISTSGLLTATAEGSVTVRATAQDGSGVYGKRVITVTTAPATTYTVAFNSNGSVYATKTVNAGESIGSSNWPADPMRSSYTFGGWFTGENGAGTRFTSATPVNTAITVYAKWTYSGGGGGGSSTPSTPATPTYNAGVKAGNGAGTTLPVTVDKDTGSASIDLGSQSLTQGGTVVTIPSIPDVDAYSVGLPVPRLSANGEQGTLTIETDIGSITVLSNMLSGTGVSGSKAEITIGQGDKDSLPDDVKNAIGDKPLIQLTLKIDGKQTDWSNPNAPVTVSIPYAPTAEELANPEGIVIWYIDGSGNVVTIPNGHYDAATGTVTFATNHFSEYAVAYNKVSFNDVATSAWYNKAVSFIAAREIMLGTGNGNYSPEAKLTRGEFIVLMMRAYGIAPDKSPTDNFSDAGNAYYTGYLATAKRLGISAGVGNNLFAPEKEITRQEMFTLLYNALNVIGQLPQGDSGKTLSDFTDAGQIDAWAKDAMTLLVKTGTVGGSAGKLTPAGTTTRAEMAQVLYNLLGK